MNFSAHKPCLARLRKVWYCCCFGFTPALLGKTAERYFAESGKSTAPIEFERQGPSHPYLTVIGSPPLRFQEPPPVAVPVEQTPVAKPPNPVTVPKPVSAKPASSPPFPTPSASAGAGPKTELSANPPAGQPAADPSLPRIIPDEMRPKVRPEEFLPFFQLPGSGGPQAPDAEKLPPSTATYRQE